MTLREMNFDGLIGPTHNYAGLSFGNVASKSHGGQESHPRAAALQGLEKMKAVAAMGFDQGFIPPLARPEADVLRGLGFQGDDAAVLQDASKNDPVLLAQVSSASSMWTANAATVSPSCDTNDGRVHFTPANLRAQFHRSIEPEDTGRILSVIFADPARFKHHAPLPPCDQYGDEGAANHTRLATDAQRLHLFVYGVESRRKEAPRPHRFPARQTLEASEAIARRHGLDSAIFVQQNPDVIDQGVFHNDVISVGTGRVLLYHEQAFVDSDRVIDMIQERLGTSFVPLCVLGDELSVQDCVSSYLFNSQLLEKPDGSMILVAPSEGEQHEDVQAVCRRWCTEDTPIEDVVWMNVRESMSNGGGPACLRLRVPLADEERAAVHPGFILTPERAEQLETWINRWYPESLLPDSLADPQLLTNTRDALDALTSMLETGPIYKFQQ
ncbi:MAG: N-succinylarginine dihydrolase [Phycisphaerae bacterium]|nr:N-succinylarginine dihydrolase [Phycisphaerae bacterium]